MSLRCPRPTIATQPPHSRRFAVPTGRPTSPTPPPPILDPDEDEDAATQIFSRELFEEAVWADGPSRHRFVAIGIPAFLPPENDAQQAACTRTRMTELATLGLSLSIILAAVVQLLSS